MQFLILCKADEEFEAGSAPGPQQQGELARFRESLRQAGVLRLAGELLPSAQGARLTFDGGAWSVRRGPFGDPRELVASFAMIDVRSRDEALAWAARWPGRDGREIEVREAGCGAGCVGFDVTATAAPGGRQRFMVLLKSDRDEEAGVYPPPGIIDAMMRHNEEGVRAGIVLAGEGLKPSAKGARISFGGGGHALFDGPFTEAKELVAGFWLVEAATLGDACGWAQRYPYPRRGRVDVEVRALPGALA
ncbi:MAG: YciI family protein [Massilia sp.]